MLPHMLIDAFGGRLLVVVRERRRRQDLKQVVEDLHLDFRLRLLLVGPAFERSN